MPWCEDCEVLEPIEHEGRRDVDVRAGAAGAEGSRHEPTVSQAAGEQDETPTASATDGELEGQLQELAGEDAKAPWHFKVLMALLAIYLTWRLVQLVQLVV
jgi:hypothetical protein